ncbi:MAG: hypothetical protein R6V85_12915 [Polyangia bacterium]
MTVWLSILPLALSVAVADAGGGDSSPEPRTAPDAGAAAGEVSPAEPPPGSVTVELRDSEGKSLPGRKVFVEARASAGDVRRLEMETNERGWARASGIPVGGSEQLVAGISGPDGETLASTEPFRMREGPGIRILLEEPRRSEDLSEIVVGDLHVVLERSGDLIEVTEVLSLRSPQGVAVEGEIRLPLPAGGVHPRVSKREGSSSTARVAGEGFVIDGPFSAAGRDATLVFEVPIDEGACRIEQDFGRPVQAVRVISAWTASGADLVVDGLDPAKRTEVGGGLLALVSMGREIRDGAIEIQLSGLELDPIGSWRSATLASTLFLLALGVLLRWRGRARRRGSKSGDQR